MKHCKDCSCYDERRSICDLFGKIEILLEEGLSEQHIWQARYKMEQIQRIISDYKEGGESEN